MEHDCKCRPMRILRISAESDKAPRRSETAQPHITARKRTIWQLSHGASRALRKNGESPAFSTGIYQFVKMQGGAGGLTLGLHSFDSRRFLLHAESLRSTGIAPLPRYYGSLRLLVSLSLFRGLPSSRQNCRHASSDCVPSALSAPCRLDGSRGLHPW